MCLSFAVDRFRSIFQCVATFCAKIWTEIEENSADMLAWLLVQQGECNRNARDKKDVWNIN